MFYKKIIITIVTLFFSANSFSVNIDSLINIAKTRSGKELINIYNDISFAFLDSNSSKAIVFAQLAVDESFKISFFDGLARAYKYKGDAYYNLGKLEQSTNNFKKSRIYYSQLNNRKQLADVNVCIGVNYDLLGELEQAIRYYQKASMLYQNINNKEGYSIVIHNLGIIYYQREEYKKALEYYLASLEMDKNSDDKVSLAYSYNNVCNCYKQLGDYDKAIEYGKKFNLISEELGYELLQGASYSNIANIYEILGKYELALINNKKALVFLRHSDNYKFAVILNNISIILMKLKSYDLAFVYNDSALAIINSNKYYTIMPKVIEAKADLYSETNNYKKSYSLLLQYNALNDSLNTSEREKKILELEAKYDLDKKNKELKLLNKEKKIQDLKLKEDSLIKLSLIISSLLILIIAIVLFSKYRFRIRTGKILSEKNEELKSLNSTKDKFFSIIAHDLKNPLSSFSTISGLLVDNFDNLDKKDIKYYVEELNNSSKGLKELLQNLLLWALSRTDKMGIDKSVFNFNETVKHTFSHLQSNANEKKISLISNDNDFDIFADKNMINTVVRNLVSNSIKFTPEGGSITISSVKKDNYLQISVKDTGVGINQENIKYLFKIEKNVSTKGTNKESGSGLGLILCKEFVEKNNGKIWVKSEIDKGTEFIFTIPIA